jgi:hypothetical protein
VLKYSVELFVDIGSTLYLCLCNACSQWVGAGDRWHCLLLVRGETRSKVSLLHGSML